MDDKIILGGLDGEFEINDNQATQLATVLWLQVLRRKDDDDMIQLLTFNNTWN